MIEIDTNRKALEDYKSQLMFMVFRNVYIVLLIGGTLSTYLSTWTPERKYQITLVLTLVFSIMLSLVFIIHFKIKQNLMQERLYFSLLLLTYTLLALIPGDKYMASIAPALPGLFLLVYFTYHLRYIYVFGGTVLGILALYFFKDPNPVVTLGYGYYITFTISIIFTMMLFTRVIKLVKWYDDKLEKELNNVFEKNQELVALNEEYYAAQEELHHNYDEILRLNQDANNLNAKLEALLTVTEDGIIEYNIDEETFHFSQNAMKHLHINAYDNLHTIVDKISNKQRARFMDAWWAILREEVTETTVEVTYDDNHDFSFTFLRYKSLEGQNLLLLAVRDITMLKTHEKHIYNLAYKDMLTGLYNRLGFIENVDEFMATKQHFYLAIMDIDNFKFINNIFGYDVGDVILIEIASKLLETSFDFITRVGDDKFAFVITDKLDLHDQINKFIVNHELTIHEQLTLNIKYSIGIAEYEGQVDASELLKRAEIAMYQVKQSGKGNYNFYNEQYTEKVEKRLLISNSLEKSVQNNELYMVYQPKFSLETEEIVSFEALIRWESQEYGFIPPNIFVEIAEQSGFIKELSKFIISTACSFAKHINQGEKKYIVSINISGKQLLDPKFAETFINFMEKENISPAYIGFEITETAVIEDLELAVKELEKLHNYGVKIYLDDFGTGYSSLNYLNQLPVDVIKIDKSFIDHIASDTHDLQLVRSIIQLAQSLELETVAEGVETEEQVQLLKKYKCDIAQGYHYSRPLRTQQVIQKIQEGS